MTRDELLYNLRLMVTYRDAVRTRVPALFRRLMERYREGARTGAARLQGKAQVDVAFFLTIPGMWKADYLFRALQQHPRFHPYVVIYPYSVNKGFNDASLWETIHRTEAFVKERNFEYVIPYDEATHSWLDIRKTLDPDVVFFSTPYRDIPPQFYVYNFRDRLTLYIPYAFTSMKLYKLNYDMTALNLYGLYLLETPIHKAMAEQHARAHGANCVVTGYPGTEVYLRNDYTPVDVWKKQAHPKKRVIWAPHHTIGDTFDVSTFLIYCDTMLRLAEQYADQIQFAFKPHQLLKFKLEQRWGVERTRDYYQHWSDLSNGQCEEAGYVDLFLHSDAMIHDSGSFTTEYLFVNKPVMYLTKHEHPEEKYNEFGVKALDCHYIGRSEADIEHFLNSVVLQGNDPRQAQRQAFFESYLKPHDGRLPSEQIMQILLDAVEGKPLPL
ncbi:MAG: CDP-glycerol glycerophosphotransferase family protein [Bacteroidales bacterium]|nr:CDP-glycerol glycerophosphotransferase family protein [Bacteroidales bacterium]